MLVSIIMPTYNSGATLREAIDSVRRQTCADWELLVLDDSSTDDTCRIMQEYAEADSRIRLIENEENAGVAASRNRGVRLARGSWIAFLDSDDFWAPDKLEAQLAVAAQDPTAQFLFTGSAFIQQGQRLPYTLHVPARIGRRTLCRQNLISCSSVLVRRDLMLACPMPEGGVLHEDFAAWLMILQKVPYAVGIDRPLLFYRLSKTSKSGNKLSAARMNWNTYRRVGISLPASLYYMACYTVRGLKKYSAIRRASRAAAEKKVL